MPDSDAEAAADAAPKDIRSRIAAFENVSSASAPAPRLPPAKPAKKPVILSSGSGSGTSSTTTSTFTDPLSINSSPTSPPVIIKPKPSSISPSAGPSQTSDRSRSIGSTAGIGAGAVGLPGLATANRKPPPAIPAKPAGQLASSPSAAETPREPLVPRGSADGPNVSPNMSTRSIQSFVPLVPSRSASPASVSRTENAVIASAAPASKAAAPSVPPRLPVRKATLEQGPVDPALPAPGKPVLPPRKVGSGSSAISVGSRQSLTPAKASDPFTGDLDPFASEADPFGDTSPAATTKSTKPSFEDDFAPPKRSAALSSPKTGSSPFNDRPPSRAPSTSVGRPSTFSAATSLKPSSRSSTLQVDRPSFQSQSQSHRNTMSSLSGGGPAIASFSDFPTQFSDFSSKFLDYKPSSSRNTGYAPTPEANKPTPAPVSGSSLSTFGTRAPLVKTDINGSQAASKTGMSTPYLLRRYTEVWDGLIDAVEPEVPAGKDPRIHGRLENVLVREMWMNSKLDDKVLKKIWNECDPDKMGSLDRDGFCKGMWRIDQELERHQKH